MTKLVFIVCVIVLTNIKINHACENLYDFDMNQVGMNGDTFSIKAPKECSKKVPETSRMENPSKSPKSNSRVSKSFRVRGYLRHLTQADSLS